MVPIRKAPFEPFKVDQYFANPTSYGPHEGWDQNGLGGGNTDCGTALYPLAPCTIIHASSSTAGYGKLIVYQVDTPRGPRYIRYAHCQEFLVSVGQKVDQNTPIARMGSTGNSTACHLHWDILSKKPSSWRFYAKTRAELDEWFIDPHEFLTVYKDGIPSTTPTEEKIYTEAQMSAVRKERDDNWNLYQDAQKELATIKTTVTSKETTIQQLQRDHQSYLDKLAGILIKSQEPTLADENAIREKVESLGKEIQTYKNAALEYQDKWEREIQDRKEDYLKHQEELESLSKEVEQMRLDHAKDMDMMQKKIDSAINQAFIAEQALKAHSKFGGSLWKALGALLRKDA